MSWPGRDQESIIYLRSNTRVADDSWVVALASLLAVGFGKRS
jgi:hypothetical protein